MSIFRVQKSKSNPYVMINKNMLKNKVLSWKAKGILSYLLSLPDDWKIYESEIALHAGDGIKGTRTGIKELINAGYIVRQKKREKGKFQGYEYDVYEVSTVCLKTENGKTENGKRHTTNNDLLKNNLTKYRDKGFLTEQKSSLSFKEIILKGIFTEKQKQTIAYYMDCYLRHTGKEHPKLKHDQWQRVADNILTECFDEGTDYRDFELDTDSMVNMIDKHFKTRYENCDYNILHFIENGVKMRRFYEAVY